MADAEALRVQVHLSPALHPELFGALAGLRPRGRAERLRQLALMGLSGGRAGAAGVAETAKAMPEDPSPPVAEALSPNRARLLQGLTLSD
ncbi:hypothetical protein [Thiorhodovibrio frisius]|uniref:Uncharacterized protein n=1 Tax=Thiorhodovibrio frisius TaxID=631362 RepID=H8YW42_9GAMM|nr:hypothetical protein [Thiorhodovibrio frisius]EIC23833.1 hypothetical protein Thi970DRAFT_00345 [Thiorhodovibrio frisius]WPL22983.1 hypothetical protein Thiofri_03163 [Thiorhodovibrio frisius]WPL23158.1 hypothetical protein Thiofri_03341 [Thiorhodovibrio frisius]